MKKKVLALFLALLLTLALAACGSTGDQPGSSNPEIEPFRIGIIQPLTGTNGFGGNECKAAFEIAAEEQGTLLGRPIELVFADGPDDATSISEVERLMNVQGIDFFFGAFGFSSIPVQAAVMKNGGFMFETTTWETDLLAGDYDNYFMNMVTAENFASTGADYVLMLGKDYLGKSPEELTVGIIGNSGFPSAMHAIVNDRLTELGCKPAVYEIYDGSITDFTSIIMKLDAAKCDIVVASQFDPDAELFRKSCLSLGYEPPIVFGTGVAYDAPSFAQIGEAAEFCMSVSYTNPSMALDSTEGLAEFRDKFYAKMGHYPITHALMAYSGAQVFFQAVENAGSDDYEAIRNALYALDIPVGGTTAYWGVKFDRDTNQNIRSGDPLVIGQWLSDGNGSYEFKVVYPDNLKVADIVVKN